jgi:ribosome-binding protein aMBF1 (putative translation factor)
MSEKEFLKALGAKIRSARKAKGLSQRELAPMCDIHYSSLCFIETGRAGVNIITLKTISDQLGIGIKKLL